MVPQRTRASIHWIGLLGGCALGASVALNAQSNAADVARSYVDRHKQELGLTGSDVGDVVVSSIVRSEHNGVTHVYLQQRYRGIDVFNGALNVAVRGSDVLSVGNRFVSNIAAAAGGEQPKKAATEAAAHAAGHLKLKPTGSFAVLGRNAGPDQATTITPAGLAERPIEARLTWVESGRDVRLAWQVEIEEASGEHWWQALVDAETGASLGIIDLVIHDPVEGIASAIARPETAPAALPSFASTDGASYNVFPLPFESPSDGGRALVTNAADPFSSPFGWHDTNGAAGAEFLVTRGNNVHAYTDIDANNVADPGSDPDGGFALNFDFPFDPGGQPATYRNAAVTNLFYWNNIMHDVTARYGFDEAAGNFQATNYTGAPGAGDNVRAEAQDGSGTNNANFATPRQNADEPRPRMQMFVWTHPLPNFVTVNTPAAIARDFAASRAQFGAQVVDAGPLTGEVALANDAVGTGSDACEPLVGFPAGKIALIDRGGGCEFGFKALKAVEAGAIAAIIVNNVAGGPITMGAGAFGGQVPNTFRVVMISLDDGNLLKANLPVNATLRANPVTSISRDSDFDAGVIAHEYGHGISNRLTGGPNINCLNNAEQMGEGWSDWFALVLTTHPSDTATSGRGVGTYVSFQGADGRGIRPTPYTTDTAVNPSTYASVADVANISQPHGIGYVWNTMLWEMYWNLVDRYGYNANIYDAWSSGGNNLAIQLVMDGMKFQPCRPGFVDGRNAIIAADTALTGGENRCEIWRAFAKRGLGFSASQGDSSNRADGVAAFDLPAECTAATFGAFQSPVEGPPGINLVNAGSTVAVKFTLAAPDGALQIDSQPVDCTTLVPTGEAPAPLAAPGSTGLSQIGDAYHLNWQTDASWAGTCRRVTLRIPAAAGNVAAYFTFQ